LPDGLPRHRQDHPTAAAGRDARGHLVAPGTSSVRTAAPSGAVSNDAGPSRAIGDTNTAPVGRHRPRPASKLHVPDNRCSPPRHVRRRAFLGYRAPRGDAPRAARSAGPS
jgi:hypothetical protein